MAYNPNVLRRATARLEERRHLREKQQAELRRQVYQREPRLEHLDYRIQRTMAELASAALRGGADTQQALQSIREKNLRLQRERAELLESMGLADDALDSKPFCPKCRDTGWRGAQMCDCLKELCTQEQIQELSKLLDLGEQSFEHFRLDCYSSDIWPVWGTSPRSNMELIRDICQNYARHFGHFRWKNLFLTGAPGLGKTFLSACIARSVSEQGFSVVYDTAGNIFAQFAAANQRFPRERDAEALQSAQSDTRRYLNCDLLILDDLGSEYNNQLVHSDLYRLINTRLVSEKQTVISSNLSPEEIEQRYSPQIASRLNGQYCALRFFGDDIRRLRRD